MPIRYPIFIECCKFTLDEYWKDIFQNCSLGKFPKGVSIHAKQHIKVTAKNGVEMYDLTDNAIQMFQLCIKIFKETLGITSSSDHKEKTKQFEELTNEVEEHTYNSWNEIKVKFDKELYIAQYVMSVSEKYKLSFEETKELERKIKCGLLFKNIDIVVKNNKISNILNVKYNKKSGKLVYVNPKITNVQLKKNTHIPKENPLIKESERYFSKVSLLSNS